MTTIIANDFSMATETVPLQVFDPGWVRTYGNADLIVDSSGVLRVGGAISQSVYLSHHASTPLGGYVGAKQQVTVEMLATYGMGSYPYPIALVHVSNPQLNELNGYLLVFQPTGDGAPHSAPPNVIRVNALAETYLHTGAVANQLPDDTRTTVVFSAEVFETFVRLTYQVGTNDPVVIDDASPDRLITGVVGCELIQSVVTPSEGNYTAITIEDLGVVTGAALQGIGARVSPPDTLITIDTVPDPQDVVIRPVIPVLRARVVGLPSWDPVEVAPVVLHGRVVELEPLVGA